MWDEIIRGLKALIENDAAQTVGQNAIQYFIQEKLPDVWDWVKDNAEDALSAVMMFFGF